MMHLSRLLEYPISAVKGYFGEVYSACSKYGNERGVLMATNYEAPDAVVDEMGATIDALPDAVFDKNPEERKTALNNKLDAINNMLAVNNTKGAVDKMHTDVPPKVSGDAGCRVVGTDAASELTNMGEQMITGTSGSSRYTVSLYARLTSANTLDRFAPFGAGIGSVLVWYLMFFGDFTFLLRILDPPVGGLLAFIIACILPPYLLCTCTHRKYVVFCPAGILAVIGTHVGLYVGALIAYPFTVSPSGCGWVIHIMLVPVFLFAFLFARFGCRWSEKRERKKKFEAIRKQVLMHQETLRTKYGVQHIEISAPWVKELSGEMRVDVYVTFSAPVDVLQFEELRKEIEAITGHEGASVFEYRWSEMKMRGKISKEKLDAFGPYGAAIGAALANIFFLLFLLGAHPYFFNIYIVTLLIFPYLFCTCTHRKFKIYSPGALGGSLGAIFGFFLSLFPFALLMHTILGMLLPTVFYLVFYIPFFFTVLVFSIPFFFTVLPSFYLSRYMCNHAKKKELGKLQ